MNKKYIINNLLEGQGLGNQLWCIFSTIGLSEKFEDTFPIIGNWKFFKGNEIFDFKNIELNLNKINSNKIINLKQKYDLFSAHDFSEFDFNRLKLLLNSSYSTEITGHLQFSKYLPKDIFKYFTFLFDSNVQDESCIIHVRGGDYLKTATWAGRYYYEPCLNEAKIPKSYNMNVISDDIRFAKKLFPKYKILKNVSSSSDKKRSLHHIGDGIVEDFKMIYRAKINIIPSSTFSFWPAYLSKIKFGKNKKVFAPRNWFSHRFPNLECSPSNYTEIPFKFIKPINKNLILLPLIKSKYRLPPRLYRIIYIFLSLNYK